MAKGKVVGIIMGLAAAAGVMYLIKAKMSRGQKLKLKGWMLKMKGEVLDRVDHVRNLTSDAYDRIVDEVMEKYEELKDVDREDLLRYAAYLKRKWRWLKCFKQGWQEAN